MASSRSSHLTHQLLQIICVFRVNPRELALHALESAYTDKSQVGRGEPVVSARESPVFPDKLGQLLSLRMVLVFLANLYPGALLKKTVARIHALFDDMSVELCVWTGR